MKKNNKTNKSNIKETLNKSYISIIGEDAPKEKDTLFSIKDYKITKKIGQGGMGEVFLAYDPICGRKVALKRIRTDLKNKLQLQNRFFKEARITSQLVHPAIMPVYNIHIDEEHIYYTMTYVEGKTLKQILKETRQQEKNGQVTDPIGGSILALSRIFMTICQAVAFSHSRNVLHRDLKPENIMIGKYGEVIILDWGLAKLIKRDPSNYSPDSEEIKRPPLSQLTQPGKLVGTLSYMAPERALGSPATIQSDLYALGVILYQILTLHMPFHRANLATFRKNINKEVYPDPLKVAAYRDIPQMLATIVKKCLEQKEVDRYQTVDALILDLKNYLEGRSAWFPVTEIQMHNKKHWEIQENIFIAEHTAITRSTEISNWVHIMISKISFPENIRIEAKLKINHTGSGLGFLLSIPETSERKQLNDGYCLWVSSNTKQSTKLLRSTVEVIHSPEVILQKEKWYHISIEKIDNNIHFYLNYELQFSYITHIPIGGTHIGLLLQDADFSISDFQVFAGKQTLTLNCLAVPDAFLSHKDYEKALIEYRRIGYSFPGRAEGREALFRAGITLLEKAKEETDPKKKEALYDQSLEEFEKLHKSPGAPLEYLGKALTYQAQKDYEEEIKCFELCYRRYTNHPLLPILNEQVLYRMHESTRLDRISAYRFILFVTQHIPSIATNQHAQNLFNSLKESWEPLPFLEKVLETKKNSTEDVNNATTDIVLIKNYQFIIKIAFWLGKPWTLIETFEELIKKKEKHPILINNILFCLIKLGCKKIAHKKIEQLEKDPLYSDQMNLFHLLLDQKNLPLKEKFSLFFTELGSHSFSLHKIRVLFSLIEKALNQKEFSLIFKSEEKIKGQLLNSHQRLQLNCYCIWAHLLNSNWEEAGNRLHEYPLELLNKEATMLHFLYGCWLCVTESQEIGTIHFYGTLETPYPRTWNLLSHYIMGKISEKHKWYQKAFLWEKRQLFSY